MVSLISNDLSITTKRKVYRNIQVGRQMTYMFVHNGFTGYITTDGLGMFDVATNIYGDGLVYFNGMFPEGAKLYEASLYEHNIMLKLIEMNKHIENSKESLQTAYLHPWRALYANLHIRFVSLWKQKVSDPIRGKRFMKWIIKSIELWNQIG